MKSLTTKDGAVFYFTDANLLRLDSFFPFKVNAVGTVAAVFARQYGTLYDGVYTVDFLDGSILTYNDNYDDYRGYIEFRFANGRSLNESRNKDEMGFTYIYFDPRAEYKTYQGSIGSIVPFYGNSSSHSPGELSLGNYNDYPDFGSGRCCKLGALAGLTVQWDYINSLDDKEPDDPGGNSGEGGGSGTFDNTSDLVDFPDLPTLSAVSAGFVSLYAPTLSQMNNLSSYMWSDAFDINNFKKLFADPMDVVIGLSIVPVSVPKGTDKEIKIGLVSTGVTMTQAASQYVTVDCGTIDVKEYWGSALDYSPYTKFSIYLPYIGTRDIKTDDIMGKTVQVKYNIDILSGSCTAMIKCGESVLYEYSGSCASSIPLTGNNWTALVTAGIQLAGMGIAAAATGGAAAAAAAPTAATLGNAAGSAATYAAGNVSAMKPTVQRSGGVSGSAGMLGIQRPYLIAELPRQSLAKNYKSFVGYPSNITKKLSELSGYTEIEDVHLEDIPATTSELEEIHNLLVNGVIM